ncbi:MAG: membrane protein insertase YidC [Alphaproteobacteria bacterium]|jgi:YidC/Oxa1 family membrane protein insertase|nr:membrane protein insertase YidC [Alphaproteobacteria bacterium]
MNDQNNFLMAIVLSLAVLLGWQFFVTEPRLEEERARQQAEASISENTSDPAASAVRDAPQNDLAGEITPQAESAAPQVARTAVTAGFASAPRLSVETSQLTGSIALMGARFDDLILKAYGANADEDAPRQILLQREGAKGHWQAHHGFVAAPDSPITLPDEQTVWEVVGNSRLTPGAPVTLRHVTREGIVLTQNISVDENFMFTITQNAENKSAAAVTLYPFGQITRTGTPQLTDLFILHEGPIGFFGEEGLSEVDYDDLLSDGPVKKTATGGWLGMTDKYWAAALVPPQDSAFTGRFTGRTQGAGLPTYRSDFLLAGETIAPGQSLESTSRFFAGAKRVDLIDNYADEGVTRFDLLIDWGWFYFLTKPMFTALALFYSLLGNYGLAILLVTILIKLAFFPLASRSYETMAKMKKLQPRMAQIREIHKDDRQAQQQELMKIYREEKLNPLAGCLPILVQIPVFFSIYKVLFVTIDMRHQPFFGWVQDLSAPDPTSLFNLFGLLPYDVPSFLLIGIWPLIMGVTMFVQMQMNPPPPDPIQARMFQILPIFFTFILAGFPAGLVIYWAWNNFLSLLQQGYIMRRHGVEIELLANLGFGRKSAQEGGSNDGSDK